VCGGCGCGCGCGVVYVCQCVLRVVSTVGGHELIAQPPPPRGGFLFVWFPNEESGGRGPSLKNNPNFPRKLGLFSRKIGVVFQGRSSSSRLFILEPPKKETPRGGVVSFDVITQDHAWHVRTHHKHSCAQLVKVWLGDLLRLCVVCGVWVCVWGGGVEFSECAHPSPCLRGFML